MSRRELRRIHGIDAGAHLLVERPRLFDVFGGDVRRGEPDGHGFQDGDGLDRLGVAIEVDAGDGGADVARVRDVALGLESADGFAHRDDADVHLAGEVLDDEAFARHTMAVEHALADVRVGAVGFRSRRSWAGFDITHGFLDRLHASESLSCISEAPCGVIIYDVRNRRHQG